MSSKNITKLMKDKQVEFVDLRFTDPKGKLQHLTMDATVVDEDMLNNGVFFDKVIINSDNYIYALITILGSTFYCIGGLLTLKLRNKKNENVTTSTTIWSVIFLLPCSLIIESPWNSNPTLASTISLLYLGVIATGLAWLIRFRILTVNGLVFQTQVAYLIPIFGVIFGYIVMDEIITWRVLFSLVIILLGIYIFKKNNKGSKN